MPKNKALLVHIRSFNPSNSIDTRQPSSPLSNNLSVPPNADRNSVVEHKGPAVAAVGNIHLPVEVHNCEEVGPEEEDRTGDNCETCKFYQRFSMNL